MKEKTTNSQQIKIIFYITVKNDGRYVNRHAGGLKYILRKTLYQSILLQTLCASFGSGLRKHLK